MKKSTLILIGVVVLAFLYGISVRNGFVGQEEDVNKAWANVQTQYQRRLDLIGNLVNTVKGYAKHEKETFESVTQARSKMSNAISVNASDLDEEQFKQMQQQLSQAQEQLNSGLSRLLAVSESYPELKANQNFLELQAQLEGTENRIAESRNKYNEAVRGFNTEVRLFPGNIVASICGFRSKSMYQAEAGAEKAPNVSFD